VQSTPPAIVVRLPAGPARRVIEVERPQGVVLRTRLTVRSGVRASVLAEIPGVAGVGVRSWRFPGTTCARSAAAVVCDQSQEPCPMPAARWRVTIVKQRGPAGLVSFVFRVGPPRRT
jgi:hypothetical protein